MTEKVGRKSLDWEAIEHEFGVGLISTREIARNHGCTEAAIRKRAKANGWSRDLSNRVRVEVRSKLVRNANEGANQSDRSAIKAAVNTQVEISLAQRARVERVVNIVDNIIDRVAQLDLDEIKDLSTAKASVDLAEKASTAIAKLIAVERQVWCMDAEKVDEPTRIEVAWQVG